MKHNIAKQLYFNKIFYTVKTYIYNIPKIIHFINLHIKFFNCVGRNN